MGTASISLLRQYWFNELGCNASDLVPNHVLVVPHGTLKGYKGVMFFRYQDACAISAPEELVPMLQNKINTLDAATCFSPETVSALIGDRLDRIIGPAWIGQIDQNSFRKMHSEETRSLSGSDWKSLEELLQSCSETEAAHSALKVGRSPTVGIWDQGTLIAAAGYEILLEKVAHIGVLVHPECRGRGLATKVVSGITEIALQSDLGIQYRTLCSNISSIGAARKIGYQNFAETIAARLL